MALKKKKETLKAGRNVNWSADAIRDSLKFSAQPPQNVSEECAYFKALDVEFATDKRSPLHHDNRCTIAQAGIQH